MPSSIALTSCSLLSANFPCGRPADRAASRCPEHGGSAVIAESGLLLVWPPALRTESHPIVSSRSRRALERGVGLLALVQVSQPVSPSLPGVAGYCGADAVQLLRFQIVAEAVYESHFGRRMPLWGGEVSNRWRSARKRSLSLPNLPQSGLSSSAPVPYIPGRSISIHAR
jgi:hypothetical protein